MTDTEPFAGTDRFAVEARLGSGGFGVVYAAYDREREARVALKVLRQASGEALYRFKREFRALADLVHPNLVVLYELMSAQDRWFFTMELVEGRTLLQHLRAVPDAPNSEAPTQAVLGPPGASPPYEPASAPFDYGSVRAAFRQLAEGIAALHAAGKLHCDIKPSNVLVTGAGRVVILDFGLVAELGAPRLPGADVVGTPAYMSPEQAAAGPITESSDWFGAGVMLYEALTGRRPFAEAWSEARRHAPCAPPSELVRHTPPDLDTLCGALLQFEPKARPAGREVLERLAAETASGPEAAASASTPFIGRERQSRALQEAFATAVSGRPAVALVHGRSGMGKTALVRRFLDERARRGDAAVLTGRCYEREAVPYKALDSLLDALSQHLKRRPGGPAAAPANVADLARLFPVLRRAEIVAAPSPDDALIPDPGERRRRGFAALRDLLAHLAAESPLVLFIDDLHWGDVDSALLLAEVLRPPDPPPLLLIGAYRSEDAAASPLVRTLLAALSTSTTVERYDVAVDEMPPDEARALARALLRDDEAEADALVREAAGSPFFLTELVREPHGAPAADAGGPATARLDQLIRARVERLPVAARRLLETIAIAGRPTDSLLVARAAALRDEAQTAIALLRAGRLVRTRVGDDHEQIEAYHDRIREAVVAPLTAEARAGCHRALAHVLENAGEPDPDVLQEHFYEAGDHERAAPYALTAAERAAAALAFDRAARLFRRALELAAVPRADEWRLRVSLGDALSNAGRGAEAADAYLLAAPTAPPDVALEVRRRAAEQLLRTGHIDRGLAALREVLGSLGLKLAETPRRALVSLLVLRARLAWSGLRFVERAADTIPRDELIRIDSCWSVAMGLSMVDNIRGAEFQKRHLLLALQAGEPYRVARALSAEAGYVSTAGHRHRRRTQSLLQQAMTLAERVNHPHATGLARFAAGISAFQQERFKEAHEWCERAIEILRARCTGVAWELDTMHFYTLLSLLFMGELRELSRRLPAVLQEARARGDLYAETCLEGRLGVLLSVAADQPEPARRRLHDIVSRWSQRGFHTQHYYVLLTEAEIDLYSGDGARAWARTLENEPALRRSLMRRIQSVRIRWAEIRARSAVAAARTHPEPMPLLRAAAREALRMRRERTPMADAVSRMIEASVAAACHDDRTALARLESAAAGFDAVGMGLYAAAVRRRRGERLADGRGAGLIAEADRWMREQGIRNPGRMASALVPGW